MSIIMFQKDSASLQKAELNRISSNVIRIVLSTQLMEDVYLSGFRTINENNFTVQGEFYDFTTKYRTYEDPYVIELSNDNSVYIPPEPIPEPEPYVPTLEEVKASKISELSSICNAMIESGVSIEINGSMQHFTYGITNGDQKNIDTLFNSATATGLDQPYHSTDGGCQLYTPEQIIELYIAQNTNLAAQTTYFNQMKEYIKTFTSDADKDAISEITYGQELTGIYLEKYNTMMAQSKLIVETIVKKATLLLQ